MYSIRAVFICCELHLCVLTWLAHYGAGSWLTSPTSPLISSLFSCASKDLRSFFAALILAALLSNCFLFGASLPLHAFSLRPRAHPGSSHSSCNSSDLTADLFSLFRFAQRPPSQPLDSSHSCCFLHQHLLFLLRLAICRRAPRDGAFVRMRRNTAAAGRPGDNEQN